MKRRLDENAVQMVKVSLNVWSDDLEELKNIARKERVPFTQIIRRAIRNECIRCSPDLTFEQIAQRMPPALKKAEEDRIRGLPSKSQLSKLRIKT